MIEKVQNAILKLETLCYEIAKEDYKFIKYNIPKITDEKLLKYLPILYKYLEVFFFKKTICINNEDCFSGLQKILGEIDSILSFNERRGSLKIEIDNSWEINNPDCISYNRWDKLSKIICDSLGVSVSIEKIRCDLVYSLSKEIINCKTLAAVSVYKKTCDLDYSLSKNKKECKLEYKALIDKYPGCNLNFKLFKELTDCNMSYDIIETIVCKGDNDIQVVDGDVILDTGKSKINLNKDLAIQGIIEPESIAKTLCKIEGTHYLNKSEFINLLAKDYNLSLEEKNTLLKNNIK